MTESRSWFGPWRKTRPAIRGWSKVRCILRMPKPVLLVLLRDRAGFGLRLQIDPITARIKLDEVPRE